MEKVCPKNVRIDYKTTFKRYELKYLLSPEQKERIMQAMSDYMEPDDYGRTIIRNIYFDTDNYRLARHSIEQPVYKEKLRLRSYQKAGADDIVFAELKKKYHSVVYKRRLALTQAQAMYCFLHNEPLPVHTQIAEEIEYFRHFYQPLYPVVFLSYEREAFYLRNGEDFRVTFDEKVRYRQEDISLGAEVYGTELLKEGKILMELKTSGGMPLWMSHLLAEEKIYKTHFSKYGSAYRVMS